MATRTSFRWGDRSVPRARTAAEKISPDALQLTEHTTQHPDLGVTARYTVRAGERSAPRGARQHIDLSAHARELHGRVAFTWQVMDACHEEDQRILGHAADAYQTNVDAVDQTFCPYKGLYFYCDIGDAGQTVIPHCPDRELTVEEAPPRR